jgi:DNA-binding response OmpR family regulator
VVVDRTGESVFFEITTNTFDLILLDLTLPYRDGFQVLKMLRERGVTTPVFVLTARNTLEDRVSALDGGADDYLTKPFAFAELLARIRALLRRGGTNESPRLTVGDLTIDRRTRCVTRNGALVELTTREFELLEFLMRYEGEVVSRETLARNLWKEKTRSTLLDNVIDVHVARLRRKVDLDDKARLIHTVRGVGFVLGTSEP